jgi:hypothetical protein
MCIYVHVIKDMFKLNLFELIVAISIITYYYVQ